MTTKAPTLAMMVMRRVSVGRHAGHQRQERRDRRNVVGHGHDAEQVVLEGRDGIGH